MKYSYLFITLLISFSPLIAKAEAPKMSQKAVNETVDKYGAIYCKEGLNALKEAVQECYKNTPDTSPELDKCIVADRALASIAVRKNMKYRDIYGPFEKDPSAVDPYYSAEIHNPREKYYLSSPRFTKDPILSKLDHFDLFDYFPGFASLPDILTKRCPGTY
ncbi:unnamed protein product [Commensalibacter communis]|uniref:hypothetical protein n=1 Tax=Commensalibacter communis TaxID=2972786 RepID=UPI0022FF99E7|nr:hypothetical protein [Commensalibacter communis]CAI3927902.1 unnamed protein product [Commensalibacter communis]CAI3931395.1 unnamed protein product [Commensalibacter communis]